MTMDDDNLDSDRWDKVEVGMLCGNELVVVQTYRGTAELLSDSRNPAEFRRTELISLDEARLFVELVATSVERERETFVDLWGRAVLTHLVSSFLPALEIGVTRFSGEEIVFNFLKGRRMGRPTFSQSKKSQNVFS
jgi:hypothetical protein